MTPRRSATVIVLVLASCLAIGVCWVCAPSSLLYGAQREPITLTPRTTPPNARVELATDGAPAAVVDGNPVWVHRPYRIALTFDDGPHPQHTARLLDLLAQHEVRATFFINGRHTQTHTPGGQRARELLVMAHAAGHVIGNHTYNHVMLGGLPRERQSWEIVANEALITDLAGERPRLFRPPYGYTSRHARQVLIARGYLDARWNVGPDKHEELLPAKVVAGIVWRGIMRQLGGTVLLHDRMRQSVEATGILLAALDRENCRRQRNGQPLFLLVTLDALLRSSAESAAVEAAEEHRLVRRLNSICVAP